MRAWQREERDRRLGIATSVGAAEHRLDQANAWDEALALHRACDRDGLAEFARRHRIQLFPLLGALERRHHQLGWSLQEQHAAWSAATRRRWAARGLGEQYDRIFTPRRNNRDNYRGSNSA